MTRKSKNFSFAASHLSQNAHFLRSRLVRHEPESLSHPSLPEEYDCVTIGRKDESEREVSNSILANFVKIVFLHLKPYQDWRIVSILKIHNNRCIFPFLQFLKRYLSFFPQLFFQLSIPRFTPLDQPQIPSKLFHCRRSQRVPSSYECFPNFRSGGIGG